jgi:hypothetical protein
MIEEPPVFFLDDYSAETGGDLIRISAQPPHSIAGKKGMQKFTIAILDNEGIWLRRRGRKNQDTQSEKEDRGQEARREPSDSATLAMGNDVDK